MAETSTISLGTPKHRIHVLLKTLTISSSPTSSNSGCMPMEHCERQQVLKMELKI